MDKPQRAKSRYDTLRSFRDGYLDVARRASALTLPYLIRQDDEDPLNRKVLITPWQSVGAKGVNVLSSKLMLALMPIQTSFFKLQLDESKMEDEQLDPQIKSEIDLSFSKIERTINDLISASDDRVIIFQALKHLVVAGNALVFMGKEGLKMYPLNRYVVNRDGNGNVLEIVTREKINKKIVEQTLGIPLEDKNKPIIPEQDGDNPSNEVDVYTHVKRENNRVVWHQEVDGKILPKTIGKAPIETNPWIVLRFNTVDGEPYGRGRVEEYMGDLKSLEALSQAIVEGSAAAAKVVFVVSPSSTTKPQTLATAGNGAIVQGRPDDIGVVQVGKTADFRTAAEMSTQLEKRISDAFLILNVRQSERTTAEEVRMTQQELEEQLGGLFSLLTVDFLVPYLNRKLSMAQKQGEIPAIPKKIVKPTIVAGLNAIGRGQDLESITQFVTTISQTMGPEAVQEYVQPEELVKRLAAAQGIDTLNLVKTPEQVQEQGQQAQQQAEQMEMTKQAGQFAQIEASQPQQQPGEPPNA